MGAGAGGRLPDVAREGGLLLLFPEPRAEFVHESHPEQQSYAVEIYTQTDGQGQLDTHTGCSQRSRVMQWKTYTQTRLAQLDTQTGSRL